ncbi:MAG: putative sulfate exporter family transporter, partial [Mailhella sp.]|nr:putative sulfate exporter family transporter [Mailhella sp.]
GLIMMNGRADIEAKINKYNTIIAAEKAKPIKTIELLDAQAAKKGVTGAKLPTAKTFISYLGKPGKWSGNPMDSFISHKKADKVPAYDAAKAATKDAKAAAKLAQDAAAAANFENAELNKAAEGAIKAWQKEAKAADKAKKAVGKDSNKIPGLVVLGIGLGLITGIGMAVMGHNFVSYFIGFLGVFFLACVANVLGGYKPTAQYGVNGEIMAIATGMVIANTIGTPNWLKPAVQVEYYIKAGLVLLGAEVLFNKILAIGIPGIFVAWVVTPIVLCSTYIFGQKVLKMPSKTLNITISADMSVCGTSAAIAVAAACRAKKEELTLSVGLSMVFTAIMMIAMPAFIKMIGLPEVLGGAWIGGTVDSTGSVAAAGAFLGPKALQVAATVKMIQNVLIGVSAFCVAIYFATKVEQRTDGAPVGAMEIWNRFPKFVLGFLTASIVISFVAGNIGADLSYALIDKGMLSVTKALRGHFFTLSFVAIGLATNFRELAHYFKGGKPLVLYVCGQTFNLGLTLLMAWIMFYKVFPEITASI